MNEMSDEEWAYELSERILERAVTDTDILLSALIQIFKKLPENDLEILLYDRQVYFVCPRAHSAIPFEIIDPVNEKDEKTDKLGLKHCRMWFILLTSELLDQSANEIIYTVVHEMAHAFLEHKAGGLDNELEADRQVVRWGFEKELRAIPDNYLYGTGCDRFKNDRYR